jgi:hypothetical protein
LHIAICKSEILFHVEPFGGRMIFPVLENEDVVQVGDMTRLSALKSFGSKDEAEITKVEILPEVGGTWIDVTGASPLDWYLDWTYTGASRAIVPSVRITTNSTPTQLDKAMSIVTKADDYLFSGDTDLLPFEPDILRWTYPGRSSFLNIHRAAQTRILELLDEMGIVDYNKMKLTKAAVIDVTEVRAWSRDLTLHFIFKSLVNAVDDVFSAKAKWYGAEAGRRQERAVLRLDLSGNGALEVGEQVATGSMELLRR